MFTRSPASSCFGPESSCTSSTKCPIVTQAALVIAGTTFQLTGWQTPASFFSATLQACETDLWQRAWSADSRGVALQVQFAAENTIALYQGMVLVAWAGAIVEIAKITFAVRQFRGTLWCCAVWRTHFANVKTHFIAELVSWTDLAACSMSMPSS